MTRLFLSSLLPCTLLLTSCDMVEFDSTAREKEDFHFSYNLKSGGHLELEGFNGSIEISGWDKESVEINGTKHAPTKDALDSIKIDIASAPDSLRIRTTRPTERRGNMGVKYILNVPRKLTIDRIASSNGSIRVQQMEGSAKLRTSNGSVRASSLKGDIEVTTSNGSVDLSEFTGSAILRSSNGSIHADGIKGYFEAKTTNGAIDARILEASGRPVRAESSNGKVSLTIESMKTSDVIASTSNSSLTVKLPASVGARVKAHTSNSSITSEFDVSTQGTLSKNNLEGTIGGGGAMLDLSSSNGSIRILKL